MEHIGGRLQVSAHAPDFVRQKKRQKSWPGHYLHTYSKRASDTKRMWIFLARTDGMQMARKKHTVEFPVYTQLSNFGLFGTTKRWSHLVVVKTCTFTGFGFVPFLAAELWHSELLYCELLFSVKSQRSILDFSHLTLFSNIMNLSEIC